MTGSDRKSARCCTRQPPGTLARALEHLADQEKRDREALPPAVTAIYASDDDLEAMRERVEPVREELRAHPETGRLLERLEALVRETAGSAP